MAETSLHRPFGEPLCRFFCCGETVREKGSVSYCIAKMKNQGKTHLDSRGRLRKINPKKLSRKKSKFYALMCYFIMLFYLDPLDLMIHDFYDNLYYLLFEVWLFPC